MKKMYYHFASESRKRIQQVLELIGWDEGKAGLLLKIPLSEVQRKMRENAIKRPDAKKTSNHQ